jgi:Extensin-like protein C-terminus
MLPTPKPPSPIRRFSAGAAGASLAILLGSGGASAGGSGKRGHVKFDGGWASYPSAKYAAMSADACTRELDARGVVYGRAPGSAGVLAPVRLPKGVGGVVFRSDAPDHAIATSPFDVFDCRLTLALHDYAKILRAHEVEEVRIFSAWRPTRGVGPGPATRHPGGLAVDIARFGKKLEPGEKERRWLVVERDFHGRVGTVPCGSAAVPPAPASSDAKELRSMLCEAVDQHLFTVVLTPNYDHAHRNHFHLEVTPEVSWTLLR